jgi:hypothetical protein
MEDFYVKFIKPKYVTKDINFFYNKICDIICNDYFGQFIFNNRKKTKINAFVINGLLSSFKNTKLSFVNDVIVIRFNINQGAFYQIQNRGRTDISKLIFRNNNICDLRIEIDIQLSSQEFKNKTIYPNNNALLELRKSIHKINEFYTFKVRQAEKRRFSRIHKYLKNLKSTQYNEWNDFLRLLKDSTNPSFQEELMKLKSVISGIDTDSINMIHKIVHHSELYRNFIHSKQIKKDKFIKNIHKSCMDSDEIIHLSNNIARCMGHKIKTLEESNDFLSNVLDHFNRLCNANLQSIQKLYDKDR